MLSDENEGRIELSSCPNHEFSGDLLGVFFGVWDSQIGRLAENFSVGDDVVVCVRGVQQRSSLRGNCLFSRHFLAFAPKPRGLRCDWRACPVRMNFARVSKVAFPCSVKSAILQKVN